MPRNNVSRSVISFSAAIGACEKGGQWLKACHLLEAMLKGKVTPDVIIYNAAISACEKEGEWQQALNLFEAMLQGRVNPDIIVYNATISACEKGGHWQQALNLFRAMPKARATPDSISYNAAISACEKGGQWQQALNLFEEVLRAKGTPTVISHNAAISACHRGHQWQQALLLFEAMPRSTVKPNRVTLCALLDSPGISAQNLGGQIFQHGLLPILRESAAFRDLRLDLHEHSEGSARLTLQWWLSTTVAKRLEVSHKLVCIVITGYGKSREAWRTSDIQATALDLLKELEIDARILRENKGRIGLYLTKQDLAKLHAAGKIFSNTGNG